MKGKANLWEWSLGFLIFSRVSRFCLWTSYFHNKICNYSHHSWVVRVRPYLERCGALIFSMIGNQLGKRINCGYSLGWFHQSLLHDYHWLAKRFQINISNRINKNIFAKAYKNNTSIHFDQLKIHLVQGNGYLINLCKSINTIL